MRRELAQAMAAVAAQQERAVEAQRLVASGLAGLRRLVEAPTELAALRAGHDELALARARAAHERATVQRLSEVVDERRADLMRASRERAVIPMDELALRRRASRRPSGVAA